MITLPIPTLLNGLQLANELKAAKIAVDFHAQDGQLIFDADAAQESKIKAVLDAHVAIFSEPTVAEKLASVGLSLDELKAALA